MLLKFHALSNSNNNSNDNNNNKKTNQRDMLSQIEITVTYYSFLCDQTTECVLTCQRQWVINNFVLQFFGYYISCPLAIIFTETSDLPTSDMLDPTKMWSFLRTILRILQHPKVLMFLSVITIFFLLNR